VDYRIRRYGLEQGALEIQYIEEFFGEFPRRKTAAEILERLTHRPHLILMAEAPAPDESGAMIPVSYKVAHEIFTTEADAKLADLVARLQSAVCFDDRRVLYSWIGATRRDWRGQGHFRALTEEQEVWAVGEGFDEVVVKTKNKFYEMRGVLDSLQFDVVKFEPCDGRPADSKVYLSKKLSPLVLRAHRSTRTLVES
jgi:hypothetical protein